MMHNWHAVTCILMADGASIREYSSIWIRLGPGRSSIIVGFIYHEAKTKSEINMYSVN